MSAQSVIEAQHTNHARRFLAVSARYLGLGPVMCTSRDERPDDGPIEPCAANDDSCRCRAA